MMESWKDSEIEELLSAERSAPVPDPAVATRIVAQITATVALPATAAAAGTLTGAALLPKLLLLAGLSAVGIGGKALYDHQDQSPPPSVQRPTMTAHDAPEIETPALAVLERSEQPVIPAPVSAPSAPSAPSPAAVAPITVAEKAPAPKRRQQKIRPAPAAERDLILAAERRLLQTARQALRAQAPIKALAQLRLHRQRFPKGQLIQERLFLNARALLAAGQMDAARKAAQTFAQRYPRSLLLPGLSVLLTP